MTRGQSRVPLLLFLGAALLVLFALVALARYPSLFRRGAEYQSAFHSVAGLNLGDDVRYGGLLVGSVTGMVLDPSDPTRVRVTFRVSENTPVRVDTRAEITQLGLLGQPYLNLVPGAPAAAPLPAGSMLASNETLSFQDAMSRLGIFLERADSVLVAVEKLTGAPMVRFERTMLRLDSLVGTAGATSARAMDNLDQLTRSMASVLARTEAVVSSVDTTILRARPEIASAQREAVATMTELRALAAELRAATARGERVEEIMRNIAQASASLERVTERLERDPSSVFRGRAAVPKPAGPRPLP